MKKIMKSFLLVAVGLTFATAVFAQKGTQYGKKFDSKKATEVTEFADRLNSQRKIPNATVVGEISEVCQAEGCWMRLRGKDESEIFVKFKDHAFLIPKDLAGRKAYVFGNAFAKTVSVEDQRHFAEDAGKTEDEISNIKEPKTELMVEATGVVIE